MNRSRIENRGGKTARRPWASYVSILCLLFSILDTVAEDIPWPEGAVARYRVEVSAERPTNAVAVCGVRFFSGGILAVGSQHVRVTDSKGVAQPIEIIYTHPLNASMVLFPAQPGEASYYLFFGGSLTPGAATTNFHRGLFYETRVRPEGDTGSWDAIRKLWAAATNTLGVAPMPDTQSRCNPFDESDNQFLSRTWGAWQTPREDVFKIVLFAKDQGFLSVNGQPAASTPADPVAKTPVVVDVLTPRGAQTLEILQARRTGQGVTGISWLVPWTEYYYANLAARPVPAAWHPSIVSGLVRDYAVKDQATTAFFNDFQTDMVLAAEQPVLLMRFHNRTTGKTDGVAYQWDFGDGTTSAEANPSHVYVKPGRYVVTLTAGGSRFQKIVLATSFSALPAVKVPMVSSVNPFAAQEMIRLALPFLGTYDAGTIWTLMELAEQIEDPKLRAEMILKLGPGYVAKAGAMTTQMEIPLREKLADAKIALGQFDAAVAELKEMEPKLAKQRAQRIKLDLQIGRLYQLGANYPRAIEVYSKVVAEKGGDDPKQERAACIAMGDTYLQQGDLGNARKTYEQALQIEVGDGRTERERAIRRGSLYSTLRQTVAESSKLTLSMAGGSESGNRSARTSFESLVFEFPDARLNPDVVYLNAARLQAAGDPDGCIAELQTLAKVEPTGRYALRSALLEARARYVKKEYDKAEGLLEAVLKTTKEEEAVQEATALRTLVKDAIQGRAQFADAAKRFWPNNLFQDGSFETTEVVSNAFPNISISIPGNVAKQATVQASIVHGFGVDGTRCLQFEVTQDIPLPIYIVMRFPTGIGDRLFVRCHLLCPDVDFRISEVSRTATQTENLYGILGVTALVPLQRGWQEPVVNAEPWREFSWRTAPATAGAPQGYFSVFGLAREGHTIVPAGTKIYLDDVECFLAP